MRISLITRWAVVATIAASSSGCAIERVETTPAAPVPVESAQVEPPELAALPTECIAAKRYDLALDGTDLSGKPALCFKVGGTLRMQGIGPAELTVKPESLTSVHYEGGVDDVLFKKAGTVSLTFPADTGTRTIVVTVKK